MNKIIRVSDIINSANSAEVARIYNDAYNNDEGEDDGWGNIESYDKFHEMMNNAVGIRSKYSMVLTHVDTDWSKLTDGKITDIDDYYDVGAIHEDDNENYAVPGMNWGECKEMTFLDRSEKNLTIDEQAAHIYFEMTWWGWPEEAEDRLANLMDKVEEIERKNDTGK